MTKLQKKSLDKPDDVWTFEKGKLEVVDLGDVVVGRSTLEPGWSWEKCVKPVVKTNSCQVQHIGYMISGKMKVVMDDGTEQEYGPGDVRFIPLGHNAWVLGNEPVVNIDFMGIKDFSKLP
jgi:ethanolamine utilization protein EutQ (cupin superfamily)